MSTDNDFLHPPLTQPAAQIRLLTLIPSSSLPIECKLITVSVIDKPIYEALSYRWGTSVPSRFITINGQKKWIRKNLWLALFHIRLRDKERVLWVDAICINQEDVLERNHQVQQMRLIYSGAQQVLVWLGRGSDQSHLAFDALNTMRHLSPEKSFSPSAWESLNKICQRGYWSRIWVIQEIGLASKATIYCGSASARWEDFSRILNEAQISNPTQIYEIYISRARVRESVPAKLELQRRRRKVVECSLYQLIDICQYSLCSDPRDTVYGFLGLANDCSHGELEADYSKNVFEVYQDAMYFHHSHNKRSSGSSVHFDMVHFSQLLQGLMQRSAATNRAAASKESSPMACGVMRQEMFTVLGSVIGNIDQLGPALSMGIFSRPQVMEWSKKVFGNQNNVESWVSTRLRTHYDEDDTTLLMSLLERVDEETWTKVRAVYRSICYGIRDLDATPADVDSEIISERESIFENDFQFDNSLSMTELEPNIYPEPRLFVLDTKKFGIAPPSAETGDVICQYPKCDVAAILRPAVGGRFLLFIGRALLFKEDFSQSYPVRWQNRSEGLHTPDDLFNIPEQELFMSGGHYNDKRDERQVVCKIDIRTLQALTC